MNEQENMPITPEFAPPNPVEVKSNGAPRRRGATVPLWMALGIVALATLVIAGGILMYSGKVNEQTARADGLAGQLKTTKGNLASTKTDLMASQAQVSSLQDDVTELNNTVSSCQAAIGGMADSTTSLINATQALLKDGVGLGVYTALPLMKEASAKLDAAKPDINACQDASASSFSSEVSS